LIELSGIRVREDRHKVRVRDDRIKQYHASHTARVFLRVETGNGAADGAGDEQDVHLVQGDTQLLRRNLGQQLAQVLYDI
jgi:hypothetical protein